MKTFTEECKEFLNNAPVAVGDQARVLHLLSEAVQRIEAVTSQAEAQFSFGGQYATFNKAFIKIIK